MVFDGGRFRFVILGGTCRLKLFAVKHGEELLRGLNAVHALDANGLDADLTVGPDFDFKFL